MARIMRRQKGFYMFAFKLHPFVPLSREVGIKTRLPMIPSKRTDRQLIGPNENSREDIAGQNPDWLRQVRR